MARVSAVRQCAFSGKFSGLASISTSTIVHKLTCRRYCEISASRPPASQGQAAAVSGYSQTGADRAAGRHGLARPCTSAASIVGRCES